MSEIVDETEAPVPDFSSADIAQAFGATFLPMSELLVLSGVATYDQIARMIAKNAPASETGAWAQLVRALVDVLDRASVAAEAAQEAQAEAPLPFETDAPRRDFPPLSVVPGGRC